MQTDSCWTTRPDRGTSDRAFACPGPAVVEALVDPNEPPMTGHVTMDQAWHFAASLVRGQEDGWTIINAVQVPRFREVV